MKIIAGSYITKMWKEPLRISQEKCVMHYMCNVRIRSKKMKKTV